MISSRTGRPRPDGIGSVVRCRRRPPLPFGAHFDVVVSFNALHWVPEQRQALLQIASVLRPGWPCTDPGGLCSGTAEPGGGRDADLPKAQGLHCSRGSLRRSSDVSPDGCHLAASAGLLIRCGYRPEWDHGSRSFCAWSAVGCTTSGGRYSVAVLPGRHPGLVAKQLARWRAWRPSGSCPVFGLRSAIPAEREIFVVPDGNARSFR